MEKIFREFDMRVNQTDHEDFDLILAVDGFKVRKITFDLSKVVLYRQVLQQENDMNDKPNWTHVEVDGAYSTTIMINYKDFDAIMKKNFPKAFDV